MNTHDYLISDAYLTVERDPCRNVECGELEVCVDEDGVGVCSCPTLDSCSEEPVHPICGNNCVSYFNLCTMRVSWYFLCLSVSVSVSACLCLCCFPEFLISSKSGISVGMISFIAVYFADTTFWRSLYPILLP